MSITDRTERSAERRLEDPPEFELSCLFDDREEPCEVTVFPESSEHDISTHWITIDAELAVSIEEIR